MATGIDISKQIAILDEGTQITPNVNKINFTGTGITATASGNDVTVNVVGATGVWGIANTAGVYTFYSTLTLAMAAATAGQTIEMFADVVETGAVTITLKNEVNINGNGHTYTSSNAGITSAFKAPDSINVSCDILNLNAKRTNGTGGLSDSAVLFLGLNATGTINCTGSTFTNTGTGSGILMGTNSAHTINNATAYAKTTYGSIGIFSSAGAKLNNCIGYATAGGAGVVCWNGGDAFNCIGYSDSGYGVYGLAGSQNNCIGVSVSGIGFYALNSAVNCTGRSTSGTGFAANYVNNFVNCVGISVSGTGFEAIFGCLNCTGISSSGVAYRVQYVAHHNFTAKSTSNYPVWNTNGSAKLYNGVIICDWNNAAGYGVRGNGGGFPDVIINCVFNLSNASAPYLFNDAFTQAVSMSGNTYKGGAAFGANITQAIIATQDNQGNIFL
jgi:hypothetical protein